MNPVDDPRLILISPCDNVATTTTALSEGELVSWGGGMLRISSSVAVGHKVAVLDISAGDKVFKYGFSIGSATRAISAGDHVHAHNLASDYLPSTGRSVAAGEV